MLLLHRYWVACGVSKKPRCQIAWPLLCGKAGSIQENGGESVTNLWAVGTGLLSQLKGQGAGGAFCFMYVCAHTLVAFEGLLTGQCATEDGLGVLFNRVVTVSKLFQRREMTNCCSR